MRLRHSVLEALLNLKVDHAMENQRSGQKISAEDREARFCHGPKRFDRKKIPPTGVFFLSNFQMKSQEQEDLVKEASEKKWPRRPKIRP